MHSTDAQECNWADHSRYTASDDIPANLPMRYSRGESCDEKKDQQAGAEAPHHVAPNGEVEGPADHAGQATRAHTVPKRQRSQPDDASRTPPTIVRRLACAGAQVASQICTQQ